MKKALKVIGISLLIIILVLAVVPIIFESQIEEAVKNYVNKNLKAQVDFSDVNLSLLRSFPQAKVSIDNLSIINNEPFKGETLATAKSIALVMPIKDLFKKANEPIQINEIVVNEALVTLKTDTFGNNNYDIAVSDNSTDLPKDNVGNSFVFDVENYAINRSAFNYIDQASGIKVSITELNHSGQGNFSAKNSELKTTSEANVSIKVDSTAYLKNNSVKLEALIDLDLDNQIYTFKDNKGFINNLPIEFSGFVKQLKKGEGQDIDISFKNPSSSFKDFLAVIPSEFSKSIENVSTSGDFDVKGSIKGLSNSERIPNLDINIFSNNASFKYPELPKSVENISINASIKNETGHMDDTYIKISNLNFKIDQDLFKANGTLRNLNKNMLVNGNVDGVLNLANVSKAYPIELKNELQGILKGNLNTSFDMKAIESNSYDRIKNNGTLSVKDFIFSSEEIVNPINISEAHIDFKPGTTSLKSFKAITGKSDIAATGTLTNLMGFLLSDKKLKGDFDVNSNSFVVSDFMVEQASKNTGKTADAKVMKIPSFLDTTINANVKTVVYDNLQLKDVKGILRIKDEVAILDNVTSRLFNGRIALKGDINTTKDIPVFNMNLGIDGFDISESFNNLELLQTLAPIAKILQGKLNTTINLSGNLTKDYTPEIQSVNGDANAELQTSGIQTDNSELFSKLGGALNFIDFSKLDLKDLKTKLTFDKGQVQVKPFDLKYKDISITVGGSHGFDQSLNYSVVFNVPAKYLGSDINRLIGQINNPEVNKIAIPITANITGNYKSPAVKTDITSGITNLTQQLIEIKKQQLINQGKDGIQNIIGDILGKGKPKDSTNVGGTSTQGQNPVESGINDILGDVIGGKNKPKDTTKADTTSSKPKDPVADVIGSIFGKKKKKPVVKDSVN